MYNYIFDLDGTLIDASDRLYSLFLDLVKSRNMSKDKYWLYKRNGIKHRELIENHYKSVNYSDFEKQWLSLIETEYYLSMDKLFCDTKTVLERIHNENNVLLLTSRRLEKSALDELDRLSIRKYFHQILISGCMNSKSDLLDTFIKKHRGEKIVFISDMGADIELGNKHGIITVAATYGFSNDQLLANYKPNFMINSLTQLTGLVI